MKWLLKLLSVDLLVKQAFEEGWMMAHESDPNRLSAVTQPWLDKLVRDTRTWRSVDEAWVNSEVAEEVE